MKTLEELLRDLLVQGAELSIEDGKLRARAPEGVLPPRTLETLRGHKDELLRLLPEYRFEAPLSAEQEGLWFLQHSFPDSTAYNVAISLRIESQDDHAPALRRALQKLVNRNTLLRTSYAAVDGSPRQVVHAYRPVDLVEIDAAHLSEAEVLQAAAAVHHRPFDLAAEGAFRACLFRRGARASVLAICVHHIAIDGWSVYMLVDQLFRLYEADGQANPLPPVEHTYQQFVTWQRDMLAARREALRGAWLDELRGASLVLDLPADRARPATQSFRGATQRRALAPALVDGLRALARSQNTTLSTILLAAYQVLLHRYSGQDDLCVGFGASRRDREELASTFGYMVNQLVIRSRLDLEDAPDFLALVQQTRERVMAAMSRQDYPFPWLVKDLLPERDASRSPVVQVGFVYQRVQSLGEAAVKLIAGEPVVVRGARFIRLAPAQVTSEVDLVLEVTEYSAALELGLRYSTDLFDAGTIDRMARHLETLLGAVVADPGRSVARLPLLDAAEQRQAVVEWNRTAAPFASEACIHQLFEAYADRTPDAVALVDLCGEAASGPTVAITYGELDRRANQVAHHLVRLGVGPEVRVGIYLPRGADLIIALLGILKAGGAFVVLDPEHPRPRLAFLLEDTDVSVLITRAALRGALPEVRARVVEVDPESGPGFSDEPAHRPEPRATPSHLAYVLYTSGSTGQPNGVMIEHRGLVNAIEAHGRIREIGPGARQAHVLSFNFDGAIGHLFAMICAGGTIYLVPRGGDYLASGLTELMAREAITHASMPPTVLSALPDAALPALHTISVGGERCPAELVARWGRGRRMFNMYGPTEVSILATVARCPPDGTEPSIGRPIANLQAYVVDRGGQLAPPGVVGELWLGGVGVARGYLNRPELTAQKFIANPFLPIWNAAAPSAPSGASGQPFGLERLYRTGDLVRHRLVADGPPVLEFIGRVDNQVKIRGHRIELGEVERALRASAQVRDAVVTLHEAEAGAPPRLVAYVTPASAERSPAWELEQVATWNALSDSRAPGPAAAASEAELALDLRGWKSSYTGEDIPRDQMQAWAEATVARIVELAPREVLELGCGTGMLLARIAPRVARYRGTDLTQHAIDHVELLKARLPGLEHVRVSRQPAHDLTGITGERFDTVILNSVVQYFPSADYLFGVLAGVLGVMAPTGSIFLGDIRNLAVLETFHVAVERSRAGGAPIRSELSGRVQRAMTHDNELVVHPRFFTALPAVFPQITGVEIAPKRGNDRNELSLFRYDVTLWIDGNPARPADPPIAWRDAGGEPLTLAGLRDWIARTGPGHHLGLRGLPNARLQDDNAWRRWLAGEDDEPAPWRQPAADPGARPGAWEPEALYALAAELGCRVQLSWAAGRPDGSLDAIVTTGDLPAPRWPLDPPVVPGRWSELTNDPLQGRRHRALVTELTQELRAALPPHLVPSAILVLPALPMTLNGKVDLRSLPAPDIAHDARAEPVAPRTDAERKLAEIWCRVLGVPRVGIHDNFFELGGDSIVSILIISAAQAVGLSLRAAQLFEHQTIAALAAVAGDAAAALDQAAVSGPVPLTPIQRWLFAQDLPHDHFNQGFFLETPADLDPEIVRRALQHLVAHHDALRTRFTRQDGQAWAQDCLASSIGSGGGALDEVALEVVDLAALAPDEQRAAMARSAARLQASLDLAAGPIMRAAVFQLGAGRPARLLWIIHHLVVDAVSWRVLVPDLNMAYRQLAAGQAVTLQARTTPFQRWAVRLHEHARSAAFEAEHAILALAPPAPLPVDRPGGRNRRETEAELRVELSREVTRGLIKDALRPYNLGVQDILLTAVAQVVARWTVTPDVWIDLEGHGREELFDDVDLSRTVGWFTSLFPVRLGLPGDDPAAALVAVKEQLRAIPRRGIGYGLSRYLREGGEQLRWPTPEISFNYLGQFREEADAPDSFRLTWEDAGPLSAAVGTRSHVLAVNAVVADERLMVVFGYNRELHDAATVARLASDVLTAIEGLVQHCLSSEAGGWSPSDFPFAGLGRAELAGLVERLGEVKRSKIEAIYPLTPLQGGMLFHTLHGETKDAYTTQLALTLEGVLDVAVLRAAWDSVLHRHIALRSCFFWDGLKAPVQVVMRKVALPWDERDGRDAPDLEAWITGLGNELAARPIALDAAPMLRLSLARTGEQRYVLFWDSHHILMDGWSMPVILREVFEDYKSTMQNAPLRVRTAGSYESYLRFVGRRDKDRSEAFWRRALHGFGDPTPLVMERSRPVEQRGYRQHVVRLDAELTTRLRTTSDAEHVTLATVLEGAWALYLSRTSGLPEVLFGTVVSGRDAPVSGIENMVGLFIQTLPVRVHIDEASEVWAWLRALQVESVAMREHQYTPLVELQQIAGVPAGTPLFRSVVVFENYPLDTAIIGGKDLSVAFRGGVSPTHYPLMLTAYLGKELHISFDYDLVRFDPQSIERVAGHVMQILRGMLGAAAPRISDLSLLTDGEREQVVVAWNRTALAHDRDRSIHALFEAQVARTPDAPAVFFDDRVISYAELDRRANRLARYLQRMGVVPETRVGICVGRSDDLIVSLFAVLKSGGAYVPMDPAYPPARLALMAQDAAVKLIVTEGELCAWLADPEVGRIELDRGAAAIAAEDDRGLAEVASERLAYVMYTSGSTGRPKGVAIEHRNVVALLHAALTQYTAEELQGVSVCTSISFDLSVTEIFVPLIAGGALIVTADALALAHAPARDRVKLFSGVPSAIAALVNAGAIPASVRGINSIGEKLGNELVQRVYQVPGIERFYNLYGPTETTSYSSYSLTQRAVTHEPTLGRPIANTQIFVLDQRLRPVPVGIPGEIYIGGEGVGRGYWNRPELTAERFLNNPFGPGRIYRTGDLGRFRSDGEIEYLGRIDGQVKLRGFRVELGEIEATMERIAGVERAVAIVHGAPPHQRLVAYWTAAPEHPPEDLRAQLAGALPDFMVPDVYVRMAELPLTASGKVDRRALRPPEDADLRRGEYRAPETDTERVLAAIWCEVLGVARVGVHDNFFALGGHSLLALTMVTRVKLELGRRVPIATLFEAPTLRDLAHWLAKPEPAATAAHPLVIPFQTRGSRTPLFCIGGFGVNVSYLHAIAPALGEDQPFYGLQFLDPQAEMPDVSRMEDLGERFADIVQEIQPSGPYTLSGHSAGTWLALAIALALEARGQRTALALLDMSAPVVGEERSLWDQDVSLMGYVRYIWLARGMRGKPTRSELFELDLEAIVQLPEDDPRTWQRIADGLQQDHLLPPGDGVEILRRMIRLRQRVSRMMRAYVPEAPYRRHAMLLMAEQHPPEMLRRCTEGWQQICAHPVQTFLVPGDHESMIREPHVAAVAAHLRRLVDEHQAPGHLPREPGLDQLG